MISSVMEEVGMPFSQSYKINFDGKPYAVKVARTVWVGGKSLVDYLSTSPKYKELDSTLTIDWFILC